MARSFFDKLNTLVKSQINDIISPIDEQTSRARRKALSRQDIREGLQGDVKVLRERIDDALAYQDELQAKVDKLYAEIADWDGKADAAVQEGRDADARVAIGRLQQAQRELEMTESALLEHRLLTQDLISQVNTLDGVLEEARNAGQTGDNIGEETDRDIDAIGDQILKRMDETRKQLGDLVSGYYQQAQDSLSGVTHPREEAKPKPPVQRSRTASNPRPAPQHPVNREKVDKDLEARLARLSKPAKDD